MRPGLQAADVILLLGFLWRIPPDDSGRDQAERLMELALTGLAGTAHPPAAPAAREE